MYSEKFFKISTKLLRSPFSVMLRTFLTRRHSKTTWSLKRHSRVTQRTLQGTLGHSRHSGTRALNALGHSKDSPALGHSRHLGTRAYEAFGYLKGTWALEALYLADSIATKFWCFDITNSEKTSEILRNPQKWQ